MARTSPKEKEKLLLLARIQFFKVPKILSLIISTDSALSGPKTPFECEKCDNFL